MTSNLPADRASLIEVAPSGDHRCPAVATRGAPEQRRGPASFGRHTGSAAHNTERVFAVNLTLLDLRFLLRVPIFTLLFGALPDLVTYTVLAVLVAGSIFFLVSLGMGGPLWERWMQLLGAVVRRQEGE